MPSLRETLKELYDGIMEEARANPPAWSGQAVPGQAVPTTAQAEAARLYAAAVAKAAGTTAPTSAAGSTMPSSGQPTGTPDDESTAATAASDPTRGAEVLRALSTLHPDHLAQGIILAEVLGKPLSRRRYPGR